MRKVVAVELVSVDGVIESPEEWAFATGVLYLTYRPADEHGA